MGGLHKGHAELIKVANQTSLGESKRVLVSVFINPLQFGPKEDFESYPRTLNNDCNLAQKNGADAIWAPSVNEIFPNGINSHFSIKVPKHLTTHLCGSCRPGHFDGVASVIVRLLSLVKPKLLILGEKDWQQLVIIRHLIDDLGLPIHIKGVPTIRDKHGLALSSRNSYLKANEKETALHLPRLLKESAKDVKNGLFLNKEKLSSKLEKYGLKVEYIETVDPYQLQPMKEGKQLCMLAVALKCGETRLIDHTFLMTHQPIVAIDGPAGAGKSTVTREFARRLGLLYLDTGAMYRAVTWIIQEKNIELNDDDAIQINLNNLDIKFEVSPNGPQTVWVNGQDVSNIIRSQSITKLVSKVACKPIVREYLTTMQRRMGEDGGIVAEGRDIGTAVFPHAELKIFLTASASERAKRRSIDLKQRGLPVPSLKDLESQITERDNLDSSRDIAPLKKAEDAIEIITDGMNIEAVITKMLNLFHSHIPEEVWPTTY